MLLNISMLSLSANLIKDSIKELNFSTSFSSDEVPRVTIIKLHPLIAFKLSGNKKDVIKKIIVKI